MRVFKELVQHGEIITAYQGLMHYFRDLRTHFEKRYPDISVPGNIYYGYLDMTYFALMPESLKSRKLKIALVFVYETFRFEVWLSGANRKVQEEYWKRITKSGWKQYSLTDNPSRDDFILALILEEDPDFRNLEALTLRLEHKTMDFIGQVEGYITDLDSVSNKPRMKT